MEDKKTNNVIKVVMIALFLIGGCYYFYRSNRLKTKGVFTIAKFVKYKKGGKNAPIFFYVFSFNGKQYETSYKDVSNVDTYKYCQFIPADPTFNQILYDEVVPPCLRPNNVPPMGWKELPSANACK